VEVDPAVTAVLNQSVWQLNPQVLD